MTRELKLTPESLEQFVLAYAVSGRVDIAASAAGVNRKTIYGWLRRAETGDKLAIELVDKMSKVRAQRLQRSYQTVHDSDDWRAHVEYIRLAEKPAVAQLDPTREAWEALNDAEAVAALAEDPRVIAAVQKKLAGAVPALPKGTDDDKW